MEVLSMADSTTGTVENLALVMANLSHSIEELKATIASLNSTIDSLKAENEYLKNNNELLHEENAYLKRKLFGTKQKMNVNLNCLKISHIPEPKRNKKGKSISN